MKEKAKRGANRDGGRGSGGIAREGERDRVRKRLKESERERDVRMCTRRGEGVKERQRETAAQEQRWTKFHRSVASPCSRALLPFVPAAYVGA